MLLIMFQLFFVMGITWIAEVVSWMLLHHYSLSVTIIKASLFFDCLNALQGFTLFCTLFFGQVMNELQAKHVVIAQWYLSFALTVP